MYGSAGFRQYALLFNAHAGACLDFQGGEARIGNCNRVGGSHAAWAIRDGRIVGSCLNAKNGASQNGTPLIVWECGPGYDNARWRYLQL